MHVFSLWATIVNNVIVIDIMIITNTADVIVVVS